MTMRRPVRRYTPRRREAKPTSEDPQAAQRARQVELRLVGATLDGGRRRTMLDRARAKAKKLSPAARLELFLDLADEIRPELPAGVVRWTLPERLNEWRTG